MSTDRDWDAATYDRVSDPQFAWALEQLERLPLDGDEVVLDAGCGSGRVTAELARRLPGGRIYAVDVAPSMVEHARAALGDRATVLCQDLVELELPEPVDAVFSNATFHWIYDHDALFAALARALRPEGRLVAQCGGHGNIEQFLARTHEVAVEEPFAGHFDANPANPGRFATAEETSERLKRAGFSEVETWLVPKRILAERAFVKTVCLVRALDRLPVQLRDPFVDRVIEHCGEPVVLDYIRLNMTARRR